MSFPGVRLLVAAVCPLVAVPLPIVLVIRELYLRQTFWNTERVYDTSMIRVYNSGKLKVGQEPLVFNG